MSDTREDVDAIGREVEEKRARVDEDLDALRGQLTLGNLLDEALAQIGTDRREVREEASRSGQRLISTVFDNPLPLLCIVGGVVWLSLSLSQSSQDRRSRQLPARRPAPVPAPVPATAPPPARVAPPPTEPARPERQATAAIPSAAGPATWAPSDGPGKP